MAVSLVDTHAHLNLVPSSIRKEVVERALLSGVSAMIVVGIDLATSAEAVKLTETYESVYAAVGVHPHDAKKVDAATIERLAELARHEKVVAIGETGLDFYRNLSGRPEQENALKLHIDLAQRLNMPLIIHDREAHPEVFEILRTTGAEKVLMHCFSGDAVLAADYVDRGYMIAAAGPVTFTNADMLREALSIVPLSNLVIETDSPYLAPHPYRGKKNEPSYLPLINDALAKVKSVPAEEMARATSDNAQNFFFLDR